jgi:ABC-2 type transport system ATP-binding protein/lipopolysaccharide transport system ATP-binding protein
MTNFSISRNAEIVQLGHGNYIPQARRLEKGGWFGGKHLVSGSSVAFHGETCDLRRTSGEQRLTSIRLDHVSVSFPIYSAGSRSIRTRLMAAGSGGRIGTDGASHVVVRGLDDVTLDMAHGDRVALIGRNGAGKTTLLRVMAGIYEPVAGIATVNGKVAPLFDVGLGMDPESSGYENILLRGLYLGLSRAEIRAKADEIAEFTELGSFLGLPLRTYSAGMLTRLAFAVSTSIDPEILLLDEGVGAGDASFLAKAESRLDTLVGRAGILVLASHSEGLVRRLCTTAVLLDQGRVVAAGPIEEVLERYRQAA